MIIFEERFEKYIEVFNSLKKKYTGINSSFTPKNKTLQKAWNQCVDGLSETELDDLAKDIVKAMYGAIKSDWHKDSKYRFIQPELFLRADKREWWLSIYQSEHYVKKSTPFKNSSKSV